MSLPSTIGEEQDRTPQRIQIITDDCSPTPPASPTPGSVVKSNGTVKFFNHSKGFGVVTEQATPPTSPVPASTEVDKSEKGLFRGSSDPKVEAVATETEEVKGKKGKATQSKTEEVKRCARSLYAPGVARMVPEDVTYTFWRCGLGSKDGCTCGIQRQVTVPYNQVVAVEVGEYLTENSCNAQCKQGEGNECWVCVPQYGVQGAITYSCQHKADAPFSYLSNTGMTSDDCNRVGVCPKLEQVPYVKV